MASSATSLTLRYFTCSCSCSAGICEVNILYTLRLGSTITSIANTQEIKQPTVSSLGTTS